MNSVSFYPKIKREDKNSHRYTADGDKNKIRTVINESF